MGVKASAIVLSRPPQPQRAFYSMVTERLGKPAQVN